MEVLAERISQDIVKRSHGRIHHLLVVAISGPDCSGKSTLTKRLCAQLEVSGALVNLVSADDYLVPRAERGGDPSEGWSYYDRGFDYSQLRSRIKREAGALFETRSPSSKIVLAEGVFLLRRSMLDLWDYAIWMDIQDDTLLKRAIRRDKEVFGSEEAVQEVYLQRCIPAQRLHLAIDQPRNQADIILNERMLE